MNLQQFIQQTGTKVTVLPAEPSEVEASHAELERGTPGEFLGEQAPPASDLFPGAFRPRRVDLD